ncbi:MAG: hypothetical protein M1812_001948 [Candelaria pacifica]|nr:MAG: hypothetical protein M1812_001948 [Candelaria pacifica]
MNRSIEQALGGLVPTLSVLPQELIELATSLLAQSRTRASNLKAEEEIARSYACANIACERLKQSLNLPKIEPRPPCPPRVYKKLYQYLERTLPARTQVPVRTPKASAAARSTPTSTPIKPRTPSKQTPTKPATPRKRGIQHGANPSEVPTWIMPTIRKLCIALGVPAAPAHVLAGVSSILTLPAPSNDGKRTAVAGQRIDNVPALIVAVLFYVTTRLSGKETSAEEYPKEREAAIGALERIEVERGDREEISAEDVDDWMRDISAGGWIGLDWFENIVQGAGLGLSGRDMEVEDEEEAVEARMPKQLRFSALSPPKLDTLQTGLGTMVSIVVAYDKIFQLTLVKMQDRYDYLSEAKRMDYLEWKKGILSRIEQIEREQVIEIRADGVDND